MSLNITLSPTLGKWAREQAAQSGCESVEEFVQQVLRRERKRQLLRREVEGKLLAALDSGEPVAADAAFWEERRRELQKRLRPKRPTKRN